MALLDIIDRGREQRGAAVPMKRVKQSASRIIVVAVKVVGMRQEEDGARAKALEVCMGGKEYFNLVKKVERLCETLHHQS